MKCTVDVETHDWQPQHDCDDRRVEPGTTSDRNELQNCIFGFGENAAQVGNSFLLAREATLDMLPHPVATCDVLRYLNKLLPKPGVQESLSAVLCSSFNTNTVQFL